MGQSGHPKPGAHDPLYRGGDRLALAGDRRALGTWRACRLCSPCAAPASKHATRCASITASPSAVRRHAFTWRLVCACVFSTRPCICRRFIIREIWLLSARPIDLRDFAVVQTRTTRDRRQRHLRTYRQAIIQRRAHAANGRRDRPSPSRRRRGDARDRAFELARRGTTPRYGNTIVAINGPSNPINGSGRSSNRRAWITPNVAPTTPSATSAGNATGATARSHDPRSTTTAKLSNTRARRASTRGPAASASTNTKRRTAGSRSSARSSAAKRRTNPRGPTRLRLPPRAHLELQPRDRVIERRQKTIFAVAETLIERAVRNTRTLETRSAPSHPHSHVHRRARTSR